MEELVMTDWRWQWLLVMRLALFTTGWNWGWKNLRRQTDGDFWPWNWHCSWQGGIGNGRTCDDRLTSTATFGHEIGTVHDRAELAMEELVTTDWLQQRLWAMRLALFTTGWNWGWKNLWRQTDTQHQPVHSRRQTFGSRTSIVCVRTATVGDRWLCGYRWGGSGYRGVLLLVLLGWAVRWVRSRHGKVDVWKITLQFLEDMSRSSWLAHSLHAWRELVSCKLYKNLKQNEAHSAHEESTLKGVN